MIYKRLYFQVILRVVLLLLTCIILSRILFKAQYLHTSIVISCILVFEILELIRYFNMTNRQLEKFFASLQDRASSLTYKSVEVGGSFKNLSRRLEEINKLLKTERIEKEAQHNYLNYLVENIGIGIITFKDDGVIDLVNPAAKKIFAEENLRHISVLNKFNPGFEESITDLELNRRLLLRIIVREELFYLTVQKSLFKFQEESNWLICLQDINSELDKKELDSWQKIIRVLTHEIMSSITPVSSLSDHLLQKIQDPENPGKLKEPGEDLMEDISEGLEIIKTRGKGLMDFVEHYHSLTHPPLPKFEEVQINPFLQKILNLIKPECEKNNVSIHLNADENLQLFIDPQLIEQVILSLVNNSFQAFNGISTKKEIRITAGREELTGLQISVRDNGCGIDTKKMDNIFIPFYTTREKGSGIGLSLAKQIMRLHNGSISVKSEPGKGAEFVLKF